MLTDADCLRPNARDKREKRADGGGLRLVVTPTNARTWEWAYRFDGLARTLPLGSYPAVSIEEARRPVGEARREEDPGAKTKRAARQGAVDRARRFDAVAERWFAMVIAPGREACYAARVWSKVEADLLPALGDRDVAEITPADVLEALQAIERRSRVRAELSRPSGIFRYARVAQNLRDNPGEGIVGALLPNPPAKGQPSLPPAEVYRFMAALERSHGDDELTRLALKLTMHTVLRSNELRSGRWSEIKGNEWNVAGSRMKMKRAHVVPLSEQTVILLNRLRELTGGGPLMFPGRRWSAPEKWSSLR